MRHLPLKSVFRVVFVLVSSLSLLCSCDFSLKSTNSIDVEIDIAGLPMEGERALSFADSVSWVSIKAVNSDGIQKGTGNLTKVSGVWRGVISVSETGQCSFVATAGSVAGEVAWIGRNTINVGVGNNSVTLSMSIPRVGDRGPAGGWIIYAKSTYDATMPYYEYYSPGTEDVMRDVNGTLTPTFHDGAEKDAGFSWRFLEAAPVSTEWPGYDLVGNLIGLQWGARLTIGPTADESALGGGKNNTISIAAFHDALDTFYQAPYYEYSNGTVAAKSCADLNYGGYDDWYLPSLDETYLMFRNLPAEYTWNETWEGYYYQSVAGFSDGGDYWSSTEYDFSSAMFMRFNYGDPINSGPLGQGKPAEYNYARAARAF